MTMMVNGTVMIHESRLMAGWPFPGWARRRWPAVGALRSFLAVQAIAQLLAGLEERHRLALDRDGVAGARIAPQPGVALLDREGAEAAQLDPVPAGQRRRNLVEDGGNDAFHVALV